MKRNYKFLTYVVLLITLVFVVMPQNTMAKSINLSTEIVNGHTVSRSDIIDWRYKAENGKLYRRLYNYSKDQWIGEWELC